MGGGQPKSTLGSHHELRLTGPSVSQMEAVLHVHLKVTSYEEKNESFVIFNVSSIKQLTSSLPTTPC